MDENMNTLFSYLLSIFHGFIFLITQIFVKLQFLLYIGIVPGIVPKGNLKHDEKNLPKFKLTMTVQIGRQQPTIEW